MKHNKMKEQNYTFLNRKKLSQGCWILTNWQTFKELTIENKYESVDCITLNEDLSLVVQGWVRKVIVIKLISFEVLTVFNGHMDCVNSVVINRDSTLIFSGGDNGNVRIWDLATKKCIKIIGNQQNSIKSIALNTESTLLVTANKNIVIWDLTTSECKISQEEDLGTIFSVAFNFESSLIVSGGQNAIIQLFDVKSLKKRKLEGHEDMIKSVAFNKESSYIISGGNDRTIRVWQVDTGDCVNVIRTNFNLNFEFLSLESLQIVSGCQGTVGSWDVRQEDCIELLEGSQFLTMSRDQSMIVYIGYDLNYNSSIKILNMNSYQFKELQ